MSTCRFEAKQWVNPNNGQELFFQKSQNEEVLFEKFFISLTQYCVGLSMLANAKKNAKNSTLRRFLPPSTPVTTLEMHFDTRNFTRHLKISLLTKFRNLGFLHAW